MEGTGPSGQRTRWTTCSCLQHAEGRAVRGGAWREWGSEGRGMEGVAHGGGGAIRAANQAEPVQLSATGSGTVRGGAWRGGALRVRC